MFGRLLDRLRGNAPSLPPMDGPYRLNSLIDEAECIGSAEQPDNLILLNGEVVFSEGNIVRTCGGKHVFGFDRDITAMASSAAGGLAVALSGGEIVCRAADGTSTCRAVPGAGDITALAYDASGALFACRGADGAPLTGWPRALLTGDASGSVWRLDEDGVVQIAAGLKWPAGIDIRGDRLVVSEANALRVVELARHGPVRPLIDDLPGYPARLANDGAGGSIIALMAPRNPLLEFVLKEKAYCQRMVSDVPETGWIAPSLRPPTTFLEPMQQGAQRSLGVLKPWAPSFSLGLLQRVDANFRPLGLAASRANGTRHGLRSVLVDGGRVLATSLASGEILSLAPFGERDHER